ncbi:flippase [Levilactobacillus suantsaiihabitans]|uniref:Flippase n=1 Tax=Levilactobacillus suantsaiihabitans TaxID=2487722 RepID=A0A4Z0J6K6_9LACO|nr:flippase [Levilactobacillus suantsaiihabitans]TGD17359.1 flippase [Levilactobacillus suantsaiihabitans]
MKVLKNYLWNVFYQIFAILVPFITIPYISRVLGPSGVGINSYTNSVVQYFILFGSVGVGFYGNRQIAFVRDDKEALSATFWEILVMRTVTLSISLVFYIIFSLFYVKYTPFLLAQSILIIAAMADISWLFMGIENFKVTVLRNVIVKIISVAAIFIFVKNHGDTLLYIVIITISTLIGSLTMFPYLRFYIKKPRLTINGILKHLWPSIVLFVPQIAIQIYVVLNKTMLGNMISTDASGFYDNSDKVVRMIIAVVTATGTVLLPHIANRFSKEGLAGTHRIFQFSFDFVSFISVPLCFGLAAVANKFSILFFGPGFGVLGSLMMIESLAALFISWDNAIGMQYLIPTQQTRAYTFAVSVGAAINVLFNIPLILLYGVQGSMIATVCSELGVTACMLFSIRKQMKIRSLFDNVPKYLFSGLIMFIVVYLVDRKLSTTWMSLIIEVIIGGVVYGVFLVLSRPTIFGRISNFLKNENN